MRTLPMLRAIVLGGLSALALNMISGAHAQSFGPDSSASLAVLPAGSEDLLLAGERSKRTVVMVARPEQLVGTTSLFLTLSSAVSVAPEWSTISVAVNDQNVGTARLRSGEPYSMQFPLPAGLLQPGYNAVTFSVDQAHRVDCSIDATYELWTRIDPAHSGFAFEGARALTADYSTILGAVRTFDGVTPLRGLTDTVEGNSASRLLAAFQVLAIGASIDRPDVDFSPAAGVGPGIDVIAGSRPDVMRRLGSIASSMPLTDGVSIARRPDGRVVVALVADSDDEFAQALDLLRDGLSQSSIGSPAGLKALDAIKGVAIPASGRLTFGQMGVEGRDFGGRLFDQSVQFRLPSDFYPADYAQAQISLDALYAPGLAPGAALQFKVNDQIVSTLKLSGSRVGEARARRLPVPLSAFRPGLNTLKVEAMLPAQIDAGCSPGATADNGRRLRLAESSVLELPTIARVGRFPDLAAIDTSMLGRDLTQRLNVVTPRADAIELKVAATTLTRLAYSSGRVIETDLSTSPTLDGLTPVLMVGALRDLPEDIARSLPIDLYANPIAPPNSAPADEFGPVPSTPFGNLPTVDALTADARSVIEELKATFYGLGLTAGVKVDVLRDADALAIPSMIGTDLVVAQSVNAFGSAPFTIITAPTAEQMLEAMPQMVASGWSQLHGSGVSLATTGERLQSVSARFVQYYPSEDTSLTNMRLVAAGWLSNTPVVYVILLLVFGSLLGLFTHVLLVRTRVRRAR